VGRVSALEEEQEEEEEQEQEDDRNKTPAVKSGRSASPLAHLMFTWPSPATCCKRGRKGGAEGSRDGRCV
jgi:hypothetical protein